MPALLEDRISSLWKCVRSDSPQRHDRAADIASDIYSLCIEQITEAELAYCSSVLLNEDEGIVKFLRETATLDEFVKCKDELLRVLTEYVSNVGVKIIQYAVSIKDVCISLFSRDKTAKVKNATFPLLICVLELCGKSNITDSLNVPKIAEKYFQAALQPTKHTSTVRCGIYHLLGVLCQHFPEHMIDYSQRLVGIYTRTLKAEMVAKKGKKLELPVIAGCLKGLTAYLYNFTQSASEGSVYAQDIYNYTRKAIDPDASLSRYDVPRAGLLLLTEHGAQFKEYLAKDTEQMYTSLYKWSNHNNRECKFVGLKAMESFFQQVSSQIAKSNADKKTNVIIYQDFMKRFRNIIDDPNTSTKQLAVAIKGFGFFAKPCKVYGTTEDLQYMFTEMVQRSEQLFASTLEAAFVEEVLSHLPTFMQALSSISTELEELPDGFILSLERLVVHLFEYYPRLPNHMLLHTAIALLKLILSVATKPITFQQFLSHIVFQGLVRSCSHPVVIEAGDGGAVVSTSQSNETGTEYKIASYKDYISVWSQLMDPGKLKGIDSDFATHELRPRVHDMCYGEFVQAVLVIVKKLNLTSMPENDERVTDTTPTDATPSNEDVSSDPISGIHPTVPRDFQIFINLVELCRNLLPSVTPYLFTQWVFIFSKEIISMATQYPLVSGFYKLLGSVLNICKKIKYFEGVSPLQLTVSQGEYSQCVAMETNTDTEESLCYLLYRKFIREVIVRMQQYKDDLLSACLQLVLSIPNEMVLSELDNLLPCVESSTEVQNVLTIWENEHLEYSPAMTVITALETWMHQIPSKKLHSVVVRLLPLLDDYLQISSKTGKDKEQMDVVTYSSTKTHSSRGRNIPLKVLKQWKEGIQSSKNDLNLIRERILYLLGSLGGVVNVALLERASSGSTLSQVVSWDSCNKLEFPVPFSDLKPSIYIDPFLPRVCELAVSSSIRQTKIAACEFLHAIVLFTIGKSAQQSRNKKSPMTKIFKKIFPYLLQLGCDVERVAEQLFRPLIFQMIHWFTRNTQYESPDTIALLDAILEGLEHPTNASLRDFSSLCVREFLLWSIKQTSKKQQERSPMNTKSLLKRIYNMAAHPSATKRLGAALALNSMYPVFREEELLVDMFVIEKLVVMINSLKISHRDKSSIGTVDQCKLAIGHIARIIKAKCSLLCSQSKNRRIPRGLKSADLIQLVSWLLSQSGCPEAEARQQCIHLFIMFAPISMETKVLNTKVWVRRTVESEGGHFFVSRFERGGSNYSGGIAKTPMLTATSSIVETIKWLDYLQASFDCYIWVLKDQLVSPSEIFNKTTVNSTDRISNLFTSIEYFLSNVVYGLSESKMAATNLSEMSPLEEEQYGISRSSTVGKMMTFSEIVLVKHTSECSLPVILTLWCDSLWSVLFSVLFNPISIGVQHGDYINRDTLSKQAVKLLTAMMKHLPENIKRNAVEFFSKKLSEKQYSLSEILPLNLSQHTYVKEHLSVDVLLQGYLCLADSSLLMAVYSNLCVKVPLIMDKLMAEVNEMISSSLMVTTDKDIDVPAKTYTTELVLKLALYFYDNNVTSIIQVLLHSEKDSQNGLMLYLKYSDILNAELVKQLQLTITTLLSQSSSLPHHVSTILNGLIDYIVKDRSLCKQKLTLCFETIIDNFHQLSSWWTKQEGRGTEYKLAVIAILQKILSANNKIMRSFDNKEKLSDVVDMYCELVSDPKNTLTFKSKAIEILSSFLEVSENIDMKLSISLNNLVAHQFPLKSSELPVGSPMYNEYIIILDKLLESLVTSGSLLLLKLFINITCRETKHIHEERILGTMATFINSVSVTTAVEALNLSFDMFVNEKDYPTSSRQLIGERVCCTLIKECKIPALVDFFVSHIIKIMEIVEAKLVRDSDPKLEDLLVSKQCCFQFLEILYNRLISGMLSSMDSNINNSYCKGTPTTGKELTQAVTKSGHAAKSEDLHGDKTHYELRRRYHCYAYNMLISVISCTQTKPQFYQGFLFKEDTKKGQYLFDNLIDVEKEYKFEVELEAPIKRKKQLLSIRDELQHSRRTSSDSSYSDHTQSSSSPPFNVRYISSVYLAQSSLSSDVSQYDFSYTNTVHSSNNNSIATGIEDVTSSSYIVSEEQLEEDQLNNHECMVALMKLLDHMEHNKITPVIEKGQRSPEMPPWMSLLHKKLTEATTERNVRLFIARLIVNRSKVFEPYAKHWLPLLTRLVISGDSGGYGLHYFIVDIIATMLSWNDVAVLEDRYLASRLMEFMIEHCNHDNRSVFRNNLEIARTLVECWKDYIQIPTKLLFNSFSDPDRSSRNNRVGIQLLGIIVANNLPPFDLSSAGTITEHSYYTTFAGNMKNKYKEVYGATGEVLGMLLIYMQESNHPFCDTLQDIVINQLLVLSSEQNEDRFIMSLHKIQLHYPKIVQRFVDKLVYMLPMLQGVFRSHCLEILQSQADIQPKFYLQMKNAGLHSMLSHRDEATQIASLKIVQGMLNQLDIEEINELLSYLVEFSSNSSAPCRVTMYNILMTLYNKLCLSEGDNDISLSDSTTKIVLSTARDQLLAGLSDDTEEIRLKMYEFWNKKENLMPDTLGRLSQLLGTLYSKRTEQHFLYHATNLLLELTSRSPDFNRCIFDIPLSDCKFEDYRSIDLSWHQRHLQMTPLFAATQSSQSGSQSDSGSLGMGMGMLRATQQSLAFTPTQDAGSYTWMAPAAQSVDTSSASFTMGTTSQSLDSKQSALLFRKPTMRPSLKNPLRVSSDALAKTLTNDDDSLEEEKRREVLKLKRRFLKSKEASSSYYANTEIRKKIIREEHKRHQRAARQSHVVMYRKYRDGELPDIQIKHSEIIRPLQALAQYDNGLARLLFASLFNAIFGEIDHHLTEEEAETTKKAVRIGINTILESSQQYFPPFIGSLQDICYHESELSLSPSNITTSARISKQELIGIMLLEKQLLNVVESPKSAKRSKGTSQEVSIATETWVETSRLFKSLGDYDVVHGVFSNLDGIQDITKRALEAEERGDYLEALGLYKKALETPDEDWTTSPTQVEGDLWEDSLLNCYTHLTKWHDLDTAATNNIENPWANEVWEDTYYQEHYLPSIIKSKLKLWCLDGTDRGLNSFLEKSLQNESSRLMLESRYPEHITMAFIVKGDLDRAQYYLSLSLRAFQQDWSANGSDQLSSNVCGKLQCLQRLTEINEFLSVIRQSGNSANHESIIAVVNKWKIRYPDVKMDSIPVWDDIITNRQVMLKKMGEKISGFTIKHERDAMDAEDSGVSDLNKLLTCEYTQMCMRMAEAACIQYNFPVSKKYLHIVEKSIQTEFSDNQSIQLQWLHGIANMRLRQMNLDPSPSRCDTIISLAHKLEEFSSVPLLTKNNSVTSRHHSIKAKTLDTLAEIFSDEKDGLTAMSILSSDVSEQLCQLSGFETTTNVDPSQVAEKLWCRVISSYNSSIKCGTERNPLTGKMEPNINSLEEMASFCDKILRKQYDEDIDTGLDTTQFPSVVIAHTLKAMSLGSKQAVDQFPRLLQLVQDFPETTEQFLKKSSNVPCWMFIGWISQMVALIDKMAGYTVAEILTKIADTYPQALCYPFKVSSSGFKFDNTTEGKKNRRNYEILKDKLQNHLIDGFVEALELLNSPELVCKDFLDDIKPLLQQTKRDTTAIQYVWKSLNDHLLDDSTDESPSSLYGTPSVQKGRRMKDFYKTYHKKIINDFGKDGSKIYNMQGTQFNKLVGNLYENMKQTLRKQEGHNLLKEYSPWLDCFQSMDYSQTIEVPGQYDGKSKPLPEYHAKIAAFDSKILVLNSMRKPKRLTIIGDNTKEYMFLVKGGEDLRHDQRIEQLFDVMNAILYEDAACSQRQLSIRTYQVIPMTTRVGIIEWVKNTKPLKEFLMDDDIEKKKALNAINAHFQWTEKYGGYTGMYKKANKSEVEKKYREKVCSIPPDLLRRGFLSLSAIPEAFVLLRSHFIKTLATANICQYIIGIGDRHLSNFMVDLDNGGLVPIDFGHAFHTATQFLPLPELMPMRLTPQFINLCLPHKHSGQLRSCMVHTLRALQSSPSALLNTMDVFVKEPSVDWKNYARKQAAALKVGGGEGDSDWYPREKVRVCKKKLQGYNSSHLMLVDLKHGHGKKPEFQSLKTILLGNRKKEKCENVEEQVDCLIDHATDPNILGRTYHGWEPWV